MKAPFKTIVSSCVIAFLIALLWGVTERNRVKLLRVESSELKMELERLKRHRDHLANQLVRSGQQVEALNAKIAISEGTPANIPTAEDSSDGTIERVGQLKRTLALYPHFGIPEMRYLNDAEWIWAAQLMEKDTEVECRRALAHLRSRAKQKFIPMIWAAARAYESQHQGQRAEDPRLLIPHLANAQDAEILARYDQWEGELQGVRGLYFRERAVADNWFDDRLSIKIGSPSWSTESYGLVDAVASAKRRFITRYGAPPKSAAEIAPFMNRKVRPEELQEVFEAIEH
jgi:hypothetical protein